MEATFINYGLAVLEGFALIISPCILPILPIMLSGSLEGGRRRPLGIILGFVLTFAVFTLFSRTLLEVFAINLDTVRRVAFSLIMLFGVILMSDYLSEKFSQITQPMANIGANVQVNPSQGFLGGLMLGALVSLIWVPCAGPILALALVQVAVQKTFFNSFMTFFFFALGSVIPMLLIAILGRSLISKIHFLKKHSHTLRKIFGLTMVIGALIAAFANTSTMFAVQPTETKAVAILAGKNILLDALPTPFQAPQLEKISAWINTPEFTLNSLKGKVILIDFWTYSCINCLRTLPYLKSWYQKYHDAGLVIVGVHTPEFAFEKKIDNVKMAVQNFGIQYPVVLDNDYATWNNYQNQYWPAHYLIDKTGQVVYVHFGEGGYAETEHNIRYLLGITEKLTNEDKETPDLSKMLPQTPETYLGLERADNVNRPENLSVSPTQDYTFPARLRQDAWGLNGKWTVDAEKIVSHDKNAAIRINFSAAKVFAVMGSLDYKPITVKILLNSKPIADNIAGKDVHKAEVVVTEDRLYELVNEEKIKEGVLELQSNDTGLKIYTFTFGN